MKTKPILIVAGEPNSIFFEIFFKSLNQKKIKSPIVLVSSSVILNEQIKKFSFKKNVKMLNLKNLKKWKINNKSINLINIDYDSKYIFESSSSKSKIYLEKCFDVAFYLLKIGFTNKFINGPINKNKFLDKKYLGITEYISSKFYKQKTAMLIYNKTLSVCPVTTHLPLKLVSKKITQKLIKEKALLIDNFYKKNIGFKPKIAVTGLNPHCESVLKYNEDEKVIKPAIKSLKKSNYKISGPFSADTIFLKKNRNKYDVILGMYHDQVLSPIKTLFEYDAINITLGLPFFRISPDHGPNEKMVGKNLSNPMSLTKALLFLDNR